MTIDVLLDGVVFVELNEVSDVSFFIFVGVRIFDVKFEVWVVKNDF